MNFMSEYKKTALVLGAGLIGSHMVKRLRAEGYWVRGVDLKHTEFSKSEANEFVTGDLRDVDFVRRVIRFKGDRETSMSLYLIDIIFLLMRFISSLLIWVEQVLSLLVRTMLISCTTQSPSI